MITYIRPNANSHALSFYLRLRVEVYVDTIVYTAQQTLPVSALVLSQEVFVRRIKGPTVSPLYLQLSEVLCNIIIWDLAGLLRNCDCFWYMMSVEIKNYKKS